MKTKFIILISLISFLSAKGQNKDNITGKFYITNIDIAVSELNILDSTIVTNSKYIARSGTKFTAYEIKKNNLLLIKFWKYKDSVKTNNNELYSYISEETNNRYFIMNLDDFNKKTSEFNGKNHSFIWGFSTLPIKLRFKNGNAPFQYETGFSLGVNAGYEFQFQSRNKQSIGLLLGVGLSAVNITPETVNNYINSTAYVVGANGLIYKKSVSLNSIENKK